MNQRAHNGPTIAFDEFGPWEIRPQLGRSGGRSANRRRATYTRKHWVAFYDIHDNRLWGYTRTRKRSREVLEVLKKMRRRYAADQRIHLILDNYSPHGPPAVRRWCEQENVHMIWTPTNASWLNPIECQFTPVKEFVILNSDYSAHDDLADALRRYARYRNKHCKTQEVIRLFRNRH